MVQAVLHNWGSFASVVKTSDIHKESLLNLLSTIFIIDREGVVRRQCNAGTCEPLVFYKDLMKDDLTGFSIKTKAIKLVPFFLTMEPQIVDSMW